MTIIKDRLLSLVGDNYTRLVLTYLCYLNERSKDNVFRALGNSVRDRDGIVVGVRYIENVRIWFIIPFNALPQMTYFFSLGSTQNRRITDLVVRV